MLTLGPDITSEHIQQAILTTDGGACRPCSARLVRELHRIAPDYRIQHARPNPPPHEQTGPDIGPRQVERYFKRTVKVSASCRKGENRWDYVCFFARPKQIKWLKTRRVKMGVEVDDLRPTAGSEVVAPKSPLPDAPD
jgi:hypothetical protein